MGAFDKAKTYLMIMPHSVYSIDHKCKQRNKKGFPKFVFDLVQSLIWSFLILNHDEDIIRIRGNEDLMFLAADPEVVELVGGVHGLHRGLGSVAQVRDQARVLQKIFRMKNIRFDLEADLCGFYWKYR